MNFKKIVIALVLLLVFNVSAFAADIGVVNTDVLNFRSGPDVSFDLLGQFVKGEMMEVIESYDNGWSKVNFNGRIGYVSTKYLNIREVSNVTDRGSVERPVSIEASGYVTASALNFRSQPDINSEVLYMIPKYTQFWVIDSVGNGWYKVYYNDVVGYVSSDYVAMGQTPYPSYGTRYSVVEYAKQFLGKPYVYGGNGPNSFDCSGFAKYVYKHFGVNLSRTTYTQVNEGYYVSKDELQAGDLLFFRSGGSINHVGIYVGDGMMIHASYPGDYVRYDSITSGSYSNYYYTARRVI